MTVALMDGLNEKSKVSRVLSVRPRRPVRSRRPDEVDGSAETDGLGSA